MGAEGPDSQTSLQTNLKETYLFYQACPTPVILLKDDSADDTERFQEDELNLRRPAGHARVLRPDHQLRQGQGLGQVWQFQNVVQLILVPICL